MFTVSFTHQSDELDRVIGQGTHTTKHHDIDMILNPNQMAI